MVDAARELVEPQAIASEMGFECSQFEGVQVSDRLYADLLEACFGDLADAGDAADRQRRKEAVEVLGLDDEEAVGLAPVGGDLGEELVRRYARRCVRESSSLICWRIAIATLVAVVRPILFSVTSR